MSLISSLLSIFFYFLPIESFISTLAEKKLATFFCKTLWKLWNSAKRCKILQFSSVSLHFTLRLFKLSGHSLLVWKIFGVSLHCSFLCNFIASADFYNFFAFSWLKNFFRNKSVILNIYAVAINEINPYRVHHIEKFLVRTVMLKRWHYEILSDRDLFWFVKIFLINCIFQI